VTNQDTKYSPDARLRLSKAERLHQQRDFDRIFAEGKTHYAKGIRFVYLLTPQTDDATPPVQLQAAFVVPKRSLRKAVQRNHAKRRMREAFRLRKHQFLQLLVQRELRLILVMLCLHKTVQSQTDFDSAINHFLQTLEALLPTLGEQETIPPTADH
jgi:ribonuclease P protein component